jgi:hypothetical protein
MEVMGHFNFMAIKIFPLNIMSSVAGSLNLVPRRQYVSTGDFTTRFFTYTQTGTTARGVPIFALSQVSNTPGTFPKGHILRENGRKLVKDVNPSLNDPTNTSVQYTYLVGVINTTADPNVAGFIDPNSPLFAPFNTDKTYFLDDPNEAKDASTGLQDLGPPVYSRGDITTTAGNILATAGSVTAGNGLLMNSGTFNITGNYIQNRPCLDIGTRTVNTTLAEDKAIYLVGGFLTQVANTIDQTLTLPSTAAIVAALGNTIGASSDFIYWNAGPQKVTITRGDVRTVIVGGPSTGEVTNYLAKFTVVVSGLLPLGNVFVIRSSV